ncbi:MAG TPA: hypothetical protein PLE28_02155 [bacterium]|nr:hypothetical protein [bacterium]
MAKDYKIKTHTLKVKDKQSVNWHIKQNDYFGTLATIINLINQDYILDNKKELQKILKSLNKDLIYLQKNFIINKK